jgi:hypothetical protein
MMLYYEEKIPNDLVEICKRFNIELVDVNEKVLGVPIASALYRELGIDRIPALVGGEKIITGYDEIEEYLSSRSMFLLFKTLRIKKALEPKRMTPETILRILE